MKRELQRAAVFVGLMFVAVGVLGTLATVGHGLNALAAMVGLLGAAMAAWGYF